MYNVMKDEINLCHGRKLMLITDIYEKENKHKKYTEVSSCSDWKLVKNLFASPC